MIADVLDRCGAETGDVVFFGADRTAVVNDALGALRIRLGEDLRLEGNGITGGALVNEGRLVHLAAFRRQRAH